MTLRPVVLYIGGFARVGGIETFVRDFLLAIADSYPRRELVVWGRAGSNHRLLHDIAGSGTKISRSPWQSGCVWRLPDYLLVPLGLSAVRRAGVVIFKRPPPPTILRFLRAITRSRRIPFVLIVPYRPLEYWAGAQQPPSEFEHFDVITVQSDGGVEDLRRMGYRGVVEKIPLLPPEVKELAPFPVQSGKPLRMGFLGRLAPQKNLGYLLEIFAALQREKLAGGDGELHFYGDGEERASLERRSAELGLRGVKFHGEIARGDVVAAIDGCDLFLNTSTTEGQCVVALEVLSRGRPLVATPVGALPEVLSDPALGNLAALGDASEFARTVARLVQSIRDGAVTPESVATAFRRRYDHETVVQQYLDLLSRTVLKG